MWPEAFDPRRAAHRAVEAARDQVGDKLRGSTLYGSSVTGEFHPTTSDVNVAFVFSSLGAVELNALSRAYRTWKRCRVVRPLLLSEESLRRSLDSYPLEYLLIREHRETLSGEDYFRDLVFDREALRLEVERVLRAQELGLCLSYVAMAGTRGGARQWALQASSALGASASGLLYLSGDPIPPSREALAQCCASRFGVDAEVFARLLTIREARQGRIDAVQLLDSAQQVLNGLLETADRMSSSSAKP